MAKNINEAEFIDIVKSKEVAIIDLWAEWCGPCKRQTPIFESVAEKFGSKAKFYKVNVDDEPQVATELGVRGIPTIIVLKDGRIAKTLVGLQSEDALTKIVEEL